MRKKELPPQYLSAFALELALLLQAGIGLIDGLLMLSEDDDDRDSRALLQTLYGVTETGKGLAEALEASGRFPPYMVNMVRLAETAGRLEETLRALSAYYAQRARLRAGLRSALLYPIVLLVLMAAVVVVLITQVLPIFSDVFSQLGAQMSPFATSLMHFGTALSEASTAILVVLAALAAVCALIFLIPALKKRATDFLHRNFGGWGLAGRVGTLRFASAMAMAMASGLDAEASIDMAGRVSGGARKMDEKVADCKRRLEEGARLEEALSAAGIFSGRDTAGCSPWA